MLNYSIRPCIISGKNYRIFIVILTSIAIFCILASISSLTTRPESDEGGFANPAINLVREGHFGTTVFDMEKTTMTRINERTYWVMPLFLLHASANFRIFGFSVFSMRLVSIFWGLILNRSLVLDCSETV